jgi:hypothetical protein
MFVLFSTKSVIPAKAGIQSFQQVMDPRVKPEDDKSRVYGQALIITIFLQDNLP